MKAKVLAKRSSQTYYKSEKESDLSSMFLQAYIFFVWPQAFPPHGLGFVDRFVMDSCILSLVSHNIRGGKTNSKNFQRSMIFGFLYT
jgi:hypothetical protein